MGQPGGHSVLQARGLNQSTAGEIALSSRDPLLFARPATLQDEKNDMPTQSASHGGEVLQKLEQIEAQIASAPCFSSADINRWTEKIRSLQLAMYGNSESMTRVEAVYGLRNICGLVPLFLWIRMSPEAQSEAAPAFCVKLQNVITSLATEFSLDGRKLLEGDGREWNQLRAAADSLDARSGGTISTTRDNELRKQQRAVLSRLEELADSAFGLPYSIRDEIDSFAEAFPDARFAEVISTAKSLMDEAEELGWFGPRSRSEIAEKKQSPLSTYSANASKTGAMQKPSSRHEQRIVQPSESATPVESILVSTTLMRDCLFIPKNKIPNLQKEWGDPYVRSAGSRPAYYLLDDVRPIIEKQLPETKESHWANLIQAAKSGGHTLGERTR